MAAQTGSDFVARLSRYIGTPYRWGGDTPSGFDCSGLVYYVLHRMGIKDAPRTSEDQYAWTSRVAANQLRPGDLIFLNFPGEVSPGHVMVYAGDSQAIQAPAPGQDVQEVPFMPKRAGARVWGGKIVGYGRVPGLGGTGTDSSTLEQLWVRAGGSPHVAKVMAAIALAESGGRVNAKGGPNTNGTYDYGLWQINSSHGYNVRELLSSPSYNAEAAVAVYRSQGLTAWSTFTSGAYKPFLANAATAAPLSRPPRPAAGGSPDADSGGGSGKGADTDAAQAAAWASYTQESDNPVQVTVGSGTQTVSFGGWLHHNLLGGAILGPFNPLAPFEEAQSAVSDLGSFLKWVAWIFSPRNLLRVAEFTVGLGTMLAGVLIAVSGSKGGGSSDSQPSQHRILRKAVEATPVGREARLAQAALIGRQQAHRARQGGKTKARRSAEQQATKKAKARSLERRGVGESRSTAKARRRREQAEGIPF
jgi:NlpC/P60 family/Lysozyme like domain